MQLVRESIGLNLFEGRKKYKLSLGAGLVVIQNNKILLVHPKGSKWKYSYSIPKGHINPGEDLIDTALRETREEVGLNFKKNEIADTKLRFIDYVDKSGNVYKRVYYYLLFPSYKIKKSDLKAQQKEVDWVGFLSKSEAKKRINPKLKEVLKFLK